MIFLGTLFLASLGAQADPAPAAPVTEVVVSQNRGADDGAGTAAAPVRTVTRGLELARASGATLVRIEYGEYSADETFPLVLPAGIELRGIGAGGTILRADRGVLVRIAPVDAPATTVLAGLTLAEAEVGIDAATPKFSDAVRSPEGPPVGLRLRGVGFAGCRVGVRARADNGSLTIEGTGVRAMGCERGIDFEGHGLFSLDLRDSSFERCGTGLMLRAAEDLDPITYDGPPIKHMLSLQRCAFVDCSNAGIERRGAAGWNGSPRPAYAIHDSEFRGNRVGIELQRPAADTPLDLRRTRFHANTQFGVRVSGQRGDPDATSIIADCDFRWNGVGLHATNAHVTYRVLRSRFVDNVGNALFLSNFMTDPVQVQIAHCLIAGNGGAGVYTMADGERLACEVLHCTIVENGAGGVHRKTRHFGESKLEVRGCIVWRNAPDLVKVEPDEVFGSLIGDGTGGVERGNLSGEPGFVDPGARDYRLQPDSPCVNAGARDPRLGELDLTGAKRRHEPDLGALELEP